MSIEEVENAIRNLSMSDAHIQTPGWCRYAAERMGKLAEKVDRTAPQTKKEILVWPEASATTENIHYAFRAKSSEGDKVFNPNPSPLFPQYLGDFFRAPGYLKKMVPTPEVL